VGVVKDPVLFIQSKVRTVEYTTKAPSAAECDTSPVIEHMEEDTQPQVEMQTEDTPCQSDMMADEQPQTL